MSLFYPQSSGYLIHFGAQQGETLSSNLCPPLVSHVSEGLNYLHSEQGPLRTAQQTQTK